MEAEDVFLEMITESIDELKSGKMPKGKFLGKYMEKLKEVAGDQAFRFKRPQVIGEGKEANNNWLDYILGLTEEEFINFKQAIKKE